MSIPLPFSNDDSKVPDTPAEVEADSPCSNQDESLAGIPRAGLPKMTRGRVTSETPTAEFHLQTSGGVTSMPLPRLLADAQRRTHQQGAVSVLETPLDQPS